MSAWVQPCWPWCSSSLRAAESAVATLRSPPRQRWFGFALLLDYVFYASLFGGVLTLALPRRAVAAGVRRAVLRREVAPQRRSLWDRARGGGAGHLSAHALDGDDRPLEHDLKKACPRLDPKHRRLSEKNRFYQILRPIMAASAKRFTGWRARHCRGLVSNRPLTLTSR